MEDNERLPESRSEAVKSGYKFYHTGIPCKNNHISMRNTSSGSCVECQRLWRERNREHLKGYNRQYGQERADERRLYNTTRLKKWRDRNTDHIKIRNDEYRDKRREVNKIWIRENPDKNAAKTAKRRSSQIIRTFEGYDQEILDIYKERRRISEETGIVHHVDHIVPLLGTTVSGLHVPWNLQIITAKENVEKSNKLL